MSDRFRRGGFETNRTTRAHLTSKLHLRLVFPEVWFAEAAHHIQQSGGDIPAAVLQHQAE